MSKRKKSNGSGHAELNGSAAHVDDEIPFGSDVDEQVRDFVETSNGVATLPTEPAPAPASSDVQLADPVVHVAVSSDPPKGTRYLKCVLTLKERRRLAKKLVKTHEGVDELELKIAACKAEASSLKKAQDLALETASAQAKEYRSGVTFRYVECREETEQLNVLLEEPGDARGVLTVRCDTEEPIEWRPYTRDERQGKLFDEAAP